MNTMYLDASALWAMYNGQPGKDLVKHVLDGSKFRVSTSLWSRVELQRAVKKRCNMGEISLDDAIHMGDFINASLAKFEISNVLLVLPVSLAIIDKASTFIAEYNLYSADAVHLASALLGGSTCFIADDQHLTRLHDTVLANLAIEILPAAGTGIGSLPVP